MNFKTFLLEAASKLSDYISIITKEIKTSVNDEDLFTDGSLYLIDYSKLDDEVGKEINGYFIYKKDASNGDDFYIGKFIYRVDKKKADILIDDVNKQFTTIADTELYIKNTLKSKITV